jgi:ribonucleoside-diphosphate reductase alpha chain
MDNDKLIEINPLFKELAQSEGFYSKALINEITARSGSVSAIPEVSENVKRIFVTAHDIAPEWHIRIQAAFQNFTDNAVSKTINFRNTATVADVESAYKLAYELGCKGLTVYRDGSRAGQVLSIHGDGVVVTPPVITGNNPGENQKKTNGDTTVKKTGKTNKNDEPRKKSEKIKPRARQQVTTGVTEKMKTSCGNLYVTINRDESGLCEVFTRMGKSGGCANAQSEAVARLVSLALRSGIAPAAIVKQLRSIRCPGQVITPGGMVFSCPDAIAQALKNHMDDTVERNSLLNDSGKAPTCPECGGMVEFMEGCIICRACGYTECE